MQPHHHRPQWSEDQTTLADLGPRLFRVAGAVGLLGLAASGLLGAAAGDGLRRLGFSYLVNFAFFLSLSLGALFFVAIQHLTRASWSVVIRRLAEVLAAVMPLLGLLAIPVLLLLNRLYPWASADAAAEELIAHKRPFLNPSFFALRWLLYFVIWSGLGLFYWRRSLTQDRSADPRLTVHMENRSGPALVLFAVTVTLAAFDLLMSLDPVWYSTIFGVYYFAGSVAGFYALLTMLTLWLQRTGRLVKVVTLEHYHDYGKLMFAFVFFWAYIAFSQYLLIWYANIPEETTWFLRRQENGWQILSLALLFCHFLIPFLGLISRFAKRNRRLLAVWAVWIFVMHWLDLYWIVMPEFSPARLPWHPLDVTCFLGIGGLWLAVWARLAGRHSLVPVGDPRLTDSIGFENA
jgi:hypothetical protein